jgi:WD40 repeat protein/energy-coupling factor transporter ATP-binding protein EcfA2
MADNIMGPMRDFKDLNPFPGLRPFETDDADFFFGRERESEEILGKLLNNRFVTVIGASGSGKSSLVNCGVLPKIRDLNSKESTKWKIISFRPGNDPYGNLADALSEDISIVQAKIERDAILSDLKGKPEDISATINKYIVKSDEKILFVVDQFEELLRNRSAGKSERTISQADSFVDFIVHTVNQSDFNLSVIVIMHSDSISECAHFKGFTQLINNSNYLVPYMGRENYREVIEGPVNVAGAQIEPDLVETILGDIGERSDQLPVLQHVMMRTWAHWQKHNEPERSIGKSDYFSVGTMSDAMSLHADEAYEELSLRGKEICEIMFKTITEKVPDNKGLRLPAEINIIKSVAGCTSEELYEVIEKFRIPSRSFITPRHNIPLSDDSIIDLSHESLMRLWNRLRDWVDDEAESVQMYLKLSEASAMFQQGKTSLLRPPELQLAINWRNSHKPTLSWAVRYNPAFERAMAYLRTSEKSYLEEEQKKIRLQKSRIKRSRIISIILGVSSIIAIGFMLFAFVQKMTAERQSMIAEQQRAKAEKEKTEADSSVFLALEQQTRADSIARIASIETEMARMEKEIADARRSLAEKMAAEAVNRENKAVKLSDSAIQASLIADQKAIVATEQKIEALRLRMLSLGRSMSLKSLQLDGQKDLQTLLAYQAYLFNKNNNGLENDADIYAGLYNVARQYGNPNYKSFKGNNGQLKSIAFIPGKNEFFTSDYDGKVLKWSLDGEEQTIQVIYSGTDIIEVLAVSPDASWLACGSDNATIKMFPLKGTDTEYEMKGHTGKIKSLIFSFDGKYLYSAALDGKVLKWDIAARTNINASDGSVQITSIDISSNGNYLAGISSDGKVIVWNPEAKSDNFRIETTGKNINVIKFNPENNMLAIGDVNGYIELWDINLRKKISEVKAHSAQINDIQFNTTLKQMATASNDKTIKLFNIKDPTDLTEPPVTFNDNEGFVLVMQFSPDGQLIISGEGDRNLVGRPTHVDYLVQNICNTITRNLTREEWNTYVGKDVPYENTCRDKSYKINIEPLK